MSWLNVTYRVRSRADEVQLVASALALEQSVEVPLKAVRNPYVLERIVGRVASIGPVADGEFDVVVQLATVTTGFDVAQTINMLFGNSSLHEHVALVDVAFPEGFAGRFGGPRFGIEGLRRLLGARGRPLAGAAIKPQGLPVEKLAALCHTFALGGIDVIKDDHGLADQSYSPFGKRVRACQRAIEHAQRETGRKVLYAPSLVGSPKALAKQAKIVRDEGVGMVLLAPAIIGMPVFHEMVADDLGVPVLAHPAYSGAARVAPPFLLGKIFRMLGADAVIYPHFGGRFAYSKDLCASIARTSRAEWQGLRPALPVPAGGMSVERVPEMVRFYGCDAMLLIGGSLLTAGDALLARTREFVEKIESSVTPVPGEQLA
jgi:ribulose-bisphosphate carboxylase large chain